MGPWTTGSILVGYTRLDLPFKIPAANRLYVQDAPATGHARLRFMAQLQAILAEPRAAGVEPLRQALRNHGIKALVCRDEGPQAWREPQ